MSSAINYSTSEGGGGGGQQTSIKIVYLTYQLINCFEWKRISIWSIYYSNPEEGQPTTKNRRGEIPAGEGDKEAK